MKKLSKLMALVLALALVLSLAACSAAGKGVVGTWKYNMDFSKVMTASAAAEGEELGEDDTALLDSLTGAFDGISMVVVFDLKEDNTYSLAMDEASVTAAAEALKAKLPEIMPTLIATLFGIEESEVESTLSSLGMSMEDMQASIAEEFDVSEIAEGMDELASTGTYTYDKETGKLELTPAVEEGEEAEPMTLTVELKDNTMNVTAVDAKEAEEGSMAEAFKTLLPLTFTR